MIKSNCCGARVENDVCLKCKEHCEEIEEIEELTKEQEDVVLLRREE